jgi:hypothetical protein
MPPRMPPRFLFNTDLTSSANTPLGTSHHRALGQVVNNNVEQDSRTFSIVSTADFEKNQHLLEIISLLPEWYRYNSMNFLSLIHVP